MTDRCLQASQKLLYSLCLVDSQFNLEFTRYLYENIELDDMDQIKLLLRGSRHFARIKGISLAHIMDYGEANAALRVILPLAPKLESLTSVYLPLSKDTVKMVQEESKQLKHVHLEYFENDGQLLLGWDGWAPFMNDENVRHNRLLYEPPFMVGFKNLRSLTIREIYGSLEDWKQQLAQVLYDSPGLLNLDLSLDVSGFLREIDRPNNNRQRCKEFFNLLADRYAELGGAPLPLRTLRCGPLILPTREDSLRKLLDVSHLEDVHLENQNANAGSWHRPFFRIVEYDDDTGHESTGFAFRLFVGECPELRKLSVSRMGKDLREALMITDDSHLRRGQVAVSVAVWNDWMDMSGVSNAFFFPPRG